MMTAEQHKQDIQWHLGHSPGVGQQLGTRAYNAMRNHFGSTEWTIDDAAALSYRDMVKIPNMGKRSIQWVSNWLHANGRVHGVVLPRKSYTTISGLEANLLLFALDIYLGTDIQGHVQRCPIPGYSLSSLQALRDKLFDIHDHPEESERECI